MPSKLTAYALTAIIVLFAVAGSIALFLKNRPAEPSGMLEYEAPIDSSVKTASFLVVFRPTDWKMRTDIADATGGMNFYMAPSDAGKFNSIELLGQNDEILIAEGTFEEERARKVEIISPSGEIIATDDETTDIRQFSTGQVIIVRNPEFGNWRIRISGSGDFWVRAIAMSDIGFRAHNFVRYDAASDVMTPIGYEPSADTREILRLAFADRKTSPSFGIADQSGAMASSLSMYPTKDGEFTGVLHVPAERFRLIATGLDEKGLPYQRTLGSYITPKDESARYTDKEIEDFLKNTGNAQ
jgi:hypothetical protein